MTHVSTPNAPAALGPYSQAVDTGSTVYCSGQLGLDPATGNLAVACKPRPTRPSKSAGRPERGRPEPRQRRQNDSFRAGSGRFRHRERDLRHLLPRRLPRRSCVQIAALPKNALVEIECIAVR